VGHGIAMEEQTSACTPAATGSNYKSALHRDDLSEQGWIRVRGRHEPGIRIRPSITPDSEAVFEWDTHRDEDSGSNHRNKATVCVHTHARARTMASQVRILLLVDTELKYTGSVCVCACECKRAHTHGQ
jgi:hypothetical protein